VNRAFGHGGAFEQLSLPLQLLFSNICGITQVGTTQVGLAHCTFSISLDSIKADGDESSMKLALPAVAPRTPARSSDILSI
jgi:hypothetical protein